jgi:hypothetical protein
LTGPDAVGTLIIDLAGLNGGRVVLDEKLRDELRAMGISGAELMFALDILHAEGFANVRHTIEVELFERGAGA